MLGLEEAVGTEDVKTQLMDPTLPLSPGGTQPSFPQQWKHPCPTLHSPWVPGDSGGLNSGEEHLFLYRQRCPGGQGYLGPQGAAEEGRITDFED